MHVNIQHTKWILFSVSRGYVKQKMAFAGHVLRGSGGDNAVQILEGKARLLKGDFDVCGLTI